VLRKDHLRVSRAGGGYRPEFVGRAARPLAARLVGTYQGHVGERRGDLEAALEELEAEADDFKLVRGLSGLLERDATFETRAPLPPRRARRAAFEAAESVGVAGEAERRRALAEAADRLRVDPDDVEGSLYADREENELLAAFDCRWDPDELLDQYNLSLAQTALFDATEVRVSSSDPRAVVSAAKRLGLMYELRRTDDGRELVVTGPDALFRRTRRYGTAFARLLRTVAGTAEWELTATVDDRGTERELRLSTGDVAVPGVEPVAEPSYDSGVEADFAARFGNLELPWSLVREPAALEAGAGVMIPDFAFEYDHDDFRVFFEIMGFWTPAYVEKKLEQLAAVEDVELLVAVDESLGLEADSDRRRTGAGDAAAEVAARDHRVVTYRDRVRVKDVTDALREYESGLLAEAAAELPDELAPEPDVVPLSTLAADHGVDEAALEGKSFPEHRLVGRTLVRPSVLEAVGDAIEPGISLEEAESVLDEHGIDDASAALSALGYRVEWEGLGGGTVRES